MAPQTPLGLLPGPVTATLARQSEDCLYLNVLTPANHETERLPVMVWLHGGGLQLWSGNDQTWNGLGLAMKGVVLVSVNMRLGPLGCLAHPLLTRESEHGASGNYLFLDMVAALKWVQKNISAFGGDPDKVTIFGESGGSVKVVNLMASPLAAGLFHRAIGQSGGSGGTPLKEMEARGERVFAKLGVDKERDPLAAARAMPWENIIQAAPDVAAELKLPMGLWDSTVDGWFLPDAPANVFRAGKQNVVPFMMGANLGELTGPGIILMLQVIRAYLDLFTGAHRRAERPMPMSSTMYRPAGRRTEPSQRIAWNCRTFSEIGTTMALSGPLCSVSPNLPGPSLPTRDVRTQTEEYPKP